MSKMGRPKSDNNKDKIVAVRLTEEEHQRLTMYANCTKCLTNQSINRY